MIPIFSNQVLRGEQHRVYGDGEQTRDFTFVSDTAEGFIKLAESDYTRGEVVNLAAGYEISVNELGRLICEANSKEFSPLYLDERPGDVRRHAAGVDRLLTLTDFSLKVSMKDGLSVTLNWYESKLSQGN